MNPPKKPSGIHPVKAGSGKDIIRHSNDQHIDQDFPEYPATTAREDIPSPKTRTDRKAAVSDKIAKNKFTA